MRRSAPRKKNLERNLCTVEGCTRKGPYKLYCAFHYGQVKRGVELTPAPSRGKSEKYTVCTVDGCSKASRSSRSPYCEMHYYRLRRNGTLETVVKRVPDAVCFVEGCEEPARYADGHCRNHKLRLMRNGDYRHHNRGELAPNWVPDDELTYKVAHQRLRYRRGYASTHKCVDCGNQAKQWSYNHASEREMWGEHENGGRMPFSPDMEDYDPRCVPCHKKFDLAVIERRESGDDGTWMEVRVS